MSKSSASKRDALKAEKKLLAKQRKQKGDADVDELQADGFQLLTQEELRVQFPHAESLEPNRKKKPKSALPWKTVGVPDQFLLGAQEGGFIGLEVLEEPPANMLKFLGDEQKKKKVAQPEVDVEEENATDKQEAAEANGAEQTENAPTEQAEAPAQPVDEIPDAKSKKQKRKDREQEKEKRNEKLQKKKEGESTTASEKTEPVESLTHITLSPLWDGFGLGEELRSGLQRLGFENPTEVQRRVLDAGLVRGKDVLAASETGSGKTLAFGLPVMQQIMTNQINELCCLVLAPTRELALQVSEHLSAVGKKAGIRVTPIVGGISVQKQERLLSKNPHIVVATPGRLWELLSASPNAHLAALPRIRFLVLDEADRMVESGHFKELDSLLTLLDPVVKRQTYVLSATLTAQHRNFVPVTALIKRIKFMRPREVVDLTGGKNAVVQTLTEARIVTLHDDKDIYLAYFLREFPGRTIVFVNAISTIRRLVPFLSLLGLPVLSLHAQMQQRQRLKNLDRFKSRADTILVATDVAARGLDVELVKHVVHYQLPKTADLYVHRSGRTARANREGLAILLVSPEDQAKYVAIQKHLGRDADVPSFPVASSKFAAARKCVLVAKKIDKATHTQRAKRANEAWAKKAAEEMEMDLDEDENPVAAKSNAPTMSTGELRELQSQLDAALKRWTIPTGGAEIPNLPSVPLSALESKTKKVSDEGEEEVDGEKPEQSGEEQNPEADEKDEEVDILHAVSIPELRFAKRRQQMEGHGDALSELRKKGKQKFGKKHWKRR